MAKADCWADIRIDNLANDVGHRDILSYFKFVNIERLRIIPDTKRSHAFVLFEKGTDIDWVMSKYNRSSLHQHIMTISLIKKEITLETPHQPKSTPSIQPKTNADKICVNTRDSNAKVNRINGVDDDHDDSLERVIAKRGVDRGISQTENVLPITRVMPILRRRSTGLQITKKVDRCDSHTENVLPITRVMPILRRRSTGLQITGEKEFESNAKSPPTIASPAVKFEQSLLSTSLSSSRSETAIDHSAKVMPLWPPSSENKRRMSGEKTRQTTENMTKSQSNYATRTHAFNNVATIANRKCSFSSSSSSSLRSQPSSVATLPKRFNLPPTPLTPKRFNRTHIPLPPKRFNQTHIPLPPNYQPQFELSQIRINRPQFEQPHPPFPPVFGYFPFGSIPLPPAPPPEYWSMIPPPPYFFPQSPYFLPPYGPIHQQITAPLPMRTFKFTQPIPTNESNNNTDKQSSDDIFESSATPNGIYNGGIDPEQLRSSLNEWISDTNKYWGPSRAATLPADSDNETKSKKSADSPKSDYEQSELMIDTTKSNKITNNTNRDSCTAAANMKVEMDVIDRSLNLNVLNTDLIDFQTNLSTPIIGEGAAATPSSFETLDRDELL